MRLLSSDEMKRVESYTANFGLSYQRMMENAGSACARYVKSIIDKDNEIGRNVVIVCGKGNNGGDGFVVARKLTESGYKTAVIMACGYPTGKEAEFMFKMAQDLAISIVWYDADASRALSLIKNARAIVDAVFGFSFYGKIGDELIPLFRAINASAGIVFSIDVPSGTYCDSGFRDENCIRADHTVAISALKPAHIVHPAADCCGDIYIANIGIPNESYNFVKNSMYTLSIGEISSLIPARSETANKGDFGHLLIIAGSRNMPGAASLAAMGALRSGVGLVSVAFPEGIGPILASKLTETVLFPLAENGDGAIAEAAADAVLSKRDRFSAVLIGPGLTVCDDTRGFVRRLISELSIPVILDADALNIVAEDTSILSAAKAPVIVTPHPKEMSRLCNIPVSLIQNERIKYAKDFSSMNGVFVILKGSNTVVASPRAESVYINASGNSGMAKGGSGDVLAGIVSALIAQGISIATACAAAVFVHGHCGDKAADRLSKMGMLPSDVIDELGRVWRDYE